VPKEAVKEEIKKMMDKAVAKKNKFGVTCLICQVQKTGSNPG
jgi:hypothetical protein